MVVFLGNQLLCLCPAPALDFHEVEELMLSMEEEGMTQPDSTATEGTVDAMETQPAVTQNTSEMMESSKPEQVDPSVLCRSPSKRHNFCVQVKVKVFYTYLSVVI